ncbi:MAG: hypothetical protein ACI9QD_000931, partial [Thermoproteota archaeon]
DLKDFLKKDVSSALDCVQENLDIFIKIVRSQKPGYLSKTELAKFIQTRDFVGNTEDILSYLDAGFDVAKLIFGGQPGYISKSNLAAVMTFGKFFNKKAIIIYKKFDEELTPSTRKYAYHKIARKAVYDATTEINTKFYGLFNKNRTTIDKLDIFKIVDSINNIEPEDKRKIKDLLFVKKAFLGGNKYEVTHLEFGKLLDTLKLPNLIEAVYDIAKIGKINFEGADEFKYHLYKGSVRKLINNMAFQSKRNDEEPDVNKDSNEVVFFMDELVEALKWYKDEIGLDLYTNREALETLKGIYLTKHREFVVEDFNQILALSDDLFDMGMFFMKMYDHYKGHLDKTRRLSVSFKDYFVSSPAEVRYKERFIRITKNYRFFRGNGQRLPKFFNENGVGTGAGYQRSGSGAFEIAAIEHLIETFFDYIETEIPCDDPRLFKLCEGGEDYERTLTLAQTREVLNIFKNILYDMEIILPGRDEISAENTMLMSSLFQNQSDTNGLMDVVEVTEFAVGIFSVAQVGKDIHAEVLSICKSENPNNIDIWGRISVNCFRKHFFDVFKNLPGNEDESLASTIKDSLPKLYLKIDPMTLDQKKDLVLTMERFTRPCKGPAWEDISISKNDAISILGGLYNVESTVNRYDTNGNNQMDPDEVDIAYITYEGAVRGIINQMEMADWIKKGVSLLHKKIFLFMIKYNQVPDVANMASLAKFGKFLVSFNQKASASRTTIAGILRNIALQSKTARTSTFDCNTIRYPPPPEN